MKFLALTLASLLTVSLLSACQSNMDNELNSPKNKDEVVFDPNNFTLAQLATMSPRGAPILPAQVKNNFIKGVDLSSLIALEEAKREYYNFDGTKLDALTLLKMQGLNTVAVRIYHDPQDLKQQSYGGGSANLQNALLLAKRAQALNMNIMLIMPYSDFYTSSSYQQKPKAWQSMTSDELNMAMYTYSKEVIKAFVNQGTVPSIIQIGSALDHGMLYPQGKFTSQNNNDNFVSFMRHASLGIQDGLKLQAVNSKTKTPYQTKILIGIEKIQNLEPITLALSHNNIKFDGINLAYNPFYDGNIETITNRLQDFTSQYPYEIIVSSSYAYTLDNFDKTDNLINAKQNLTPPYPFTVKGQENYLRDLMEHVSNLNQGIGFIYVEPAWLFIDEHNDIALDKAKRASFITKEGSDYLQNIKPSIENEDENTKQDKTNLPLGSALENQALFDKHGRLLDAVKVFNDFM